MKIANVNFDVIYNPKKWVINLMLNSLSLPFLSFSLCDLFVCALILHL
jgi:hypothetical protein